MGFKSALSSFDLINVFFLGQSLVTNFGALEFAQLDLTPVLRISNLVSVGIITLVQVGIHGFLLKVFYRLCLFFCLEPVVFHVQIIQTFELPRHSLHRNNFLSNKIDMLHCRYCSQDYPS